MSNEIDIVIAGALCLDVIPVLPPTLRGGVGDIFTPGKLVNVDPIVMSTGGPVSNTGIGLKKLGQKVAFIAKVGDDEFGQIIVNKLNKEGNAGGISVSKNLHTSYTVVLAAQSFDRIFLHHPGTNDTFSSADIDEKLLESVKHFHFGYPPLMKSIYSNDGKELVEIFKIAKSHGLTTSLDMSLPDPASESAKANWRKILENVLPYMDIFLPSIEEVFFMLYPHEFLEMKKEHNGAELIDFILPEKYSSMAEELLAMGAKMTSLKSGHRGFYLRTSGKENIANIGKTKVADVDNWADRELWCPAFHVEHIATATGSGDSSIAGFISALHNGSSIEKTLKCANCVGYQNLQTMDAVSGIKSWEETISMLDDSLKMNDLHVDSKGWIWDDSFKMMKGPKDKN